jgi:hypothetical protein
MLGKKHNAAGETAVEKPRRRRVFGYISNVSTIEPRVTFLNGLTREGRVQSGQEQGKTDLTLGEEAPIRDFPPAVQPIPAFY